VAGTPQPNCTRQRRRSDGASRKTVPSDCEGIDRALALTDADADEKSEERLFALGLRRLIEGFGLHAEAS